MLNGWGRGIKTVYTQIRTQDTHITRPALYNCAMLTCVLLVHLGLMYIELPKDAVFIRS